MTKKEFYRKLREFKHDPPGRLKLHPVCFSACAWIDFRGEPLEGRRGSFDVHSIQHGDYSRRRFSEDKGYKESSDTRGNRLLEKYQRWYREWLEKQSIPAGETCKDCGHWKRCKSMIETLTGRETHCDWSPSRFKE